MEKCMLGWWWRNDRETRLHLQQRRTK
jgi:hypothetical protein